MAQKALWWVVGLVVLALLAGLALKARDESDTATTTNATTTNGELGTRVSPIAIGAPGSSAGTPSPLPDGGYELDTAASVITWTGTKPLILGYDDTGTVKLKSGSLKVIDGKVASGDFFIDMDTIAVTKTSNTKATGDMLINHLKSADFFNVIKYPNARFVITGVSGLTVTGDLTVGAVTKTVSFPAAIRAESETRVRAQAALVLNRTDWDIRYGSGSFFEDLGDNIIADQVKINLDLVATK